LKCPHFNASEPLERFNCRHIDVTWGDRTADRPMS